MASSHLARPAACAERAEAVPAATAAPPAKLARRNRRQSIMLDINVLPVCFVCMLPLCPIVDRASRRIRFSRGTRVTPLGTIGTPPPGNSPEPFSRIMSRFSGSSADNDSVTDFRQTGSRCVSRSVRKPYALGRTTMENKMNTQWITRGTIGTLAFAALLATNTGCQVSLNGQTLPSPHYLQDDVQYFPAGPEFKLSREAAALQAARAEEKRNQR